MSVNSGQGHATGAPTLGRFERFLLAWKAKILLLFGLQARANEVFEDILRRSPQDVYALNSLGYAALQRGESGTAYRYFEQVRNLTPQLSNAQFNLAFVAESLGRLDEALAALKRNTSLQPMSPFGWYQMARVHVELQQPDEAKAVIRHLKGFEPKVAAQLERETGLRPV
jgi:tetratricopeptide (TPR) repeat protein